MQNRREFISGLGGLAGLTAVPNILKAAANRQDKPNVVIFLVDDLGWGDLGCYGNTFHETPNINRLAAEGMKFTNGYAAAPVCSPSRAAIQTGQSPARMHLTQVIYLSPPAYPYKKLLGAPTPRHLDARLPTLAETLEKIGYQTAAIGKWNLGGDGYLPENFGYQVNVAGDLNGHPPPPNGYFGPFHFHNLAGYTKNDYLTDVLTQKMDEFLAHAAGRGPFFLYMAEYAVHLPLQEREALIEKYRKKNGGASEPDPIYAAMVESVDTALGNLRAKLKRLGVAENTIIILTSDNGGVGYQSRDLHRIADNGPLRAGKGFLYEGGIREPFLVYWPGVTKPGSVCEVPIIGTDLMPAILSIVGGGPAPEPCDGIDMSSLFRGKTSVARDALYWHYPHYSEQGGQPSGAIREGEWKLLEFFEDGHLELYNLTLDPGEQYNFVSMFADRATTMQRKLQAWRTSIDAAMPRLNPAFNPALAGLRMGPAGCSWEPGPGCLED